jgi:signal transduction histidine kinase
MTTHRRRTWGWFAVTLTVLLAVVGWLTATLIVLDREETLARRQAELHEKLRLALWRMDSWLSPHVVREAMRPSADYRSFAPAPAAWTKGLSRLPPNEVLVPSPLLSFRSEWFRLHFELAADGTLTSPQVPTGNQRDIAEADVLVGAGIASCQDALAELRPRLTAASLGLPLAGAEARLSEIGCNIVPPGTTQQFVQTVQEFSNRQMAMNANVGNQNFANPNKAQSVAPSVAPDAAAVAEVVGPMLPLWLESGGEPLLVFARRVTSARATAVQGVVVDWPALRRSLLALVDDLFGEGGADLMRCTSPSPTEQGTLLATVPARLAATTTTSIVAGALPTTTILAVTWGMTLLALATLAFTLRAAIGFGERRARFASAVTHELRTPLTTFRMYSEMLADDVVTDPTARHEYLQTLRSESDRLARVVENVLAWSRLEEGRFASRRERHGVASLLSRVAPTLERRLAESAMTLELVVDQDVGEAVVATDEDAVLQILFNLVDNAAKYARGATDPRVTLRARLDGATVRIAVHDRGPGVPSEHRARIFTPFDRGAVPTSSNEIPGVGLGLALARGLARDLDGDLTLDASSSGACFVLSLPTA